MTENFDFHHINSEARYRALVICFPEDPANRLEVGNLEKHGDELRLQANFDGGRLGTPGLQLWVEHIPSRLIGKVFFEPGVSQGGNFHLQEFSTKWLGRQGGGGHKYDHEPVSVRTADLEVKKRTLKVCMKSFGHVSPDPSAIDAILNALPAHLPEHRLLTWSTAWSKSSFNACIYCVVPEDKITSLDARSLAPLRRAIKDRPPPYHQFSYPRNVLNLTMPPLPEFRNHIYFNISGSTPHGHRYDNVVLPLVDTLGRREPLPVAQVNANGLIREYQDSRIYHHDFASNLQCVRVVRASFRTLSRATRAFGGTTGNPAVALPLEEGPYFACVDSLNLTSQHKLLLPRAGEVFHVCRYRQQNGQWLPTTETAWGVVLRLSPSDLAKIGTKIVLGLSMLSESLKQRAAGCITIAVAETVGFRWLPNNKVAETELEALRQFGKMLGLPMLTSLRINVLFQPLGARNVPQGRKDLRHGPNPPGNNPTELAHRQASYNVGVQDLLSQLATTSRNERDLLNHVPSLFDGLFQLLHASMAQVQFRSVLAAPLALTNAGHRIIIVVEDQAGSSSICHYINHLLKSLMARGRDGGRFWTRKKIVSYTTLEVEHRFDSLFHDLDDLSSPEHPMRMQVELGFELLHSDLPEHSFMLDQQGQYFTANYASPPPARTPLAHSMGDAIMLHHLSNPTQRGQYYADRAAVIDNRALSADQIRGIRARRHEAVRKALQGVDILVTNAATAVSTDVKASFDSPVIMLMDAHQTTFAQAISVFMAYSRLEAGFVVGVDGETQLPGGKFASKDHNEASESFFRSFWATLRLNRASTFTL